MTMANAADDDNDCNMIPNEVKSQASQITAKTSQI